jgi:hypothetical protein
MEEAQVEVWNQEYLNHVLGTVQIDDIDTCENALRQRV